VDRLRKKIRQRSALVSSRLLHWFGQYLPRQARFNLMYLGSPPWDAGVTPPELVWFIKSNPPGRAIDLGCGSGTNLIALGQAGWRVTGVDFARRAVMEARKRLEQAGIPGIVRAGDVSDLAVVRGEYDLVLDIGCYHSLAQPGREAYRQNLVDILAPGGTFLIYTHWRAAGQAGDTGISDRDVAAFQEILILENRQDSQDRWERSTSWMRFRTPDD
jgi:SAM-dependent methyltransferase